MRSTSDDRIEPPRARSLAADESGSVSLEYLLVTMACGLLVAIGLIAAIGPSLVSTWSDRRACLYDAVCLSPLQSPPIGAAP